jgi:hypothetical protein
MFFVEVILGALIVLALGIYFAKCLIHDTIKWERGTRTGTIMIWFAVSAAAYIIWHAILGPWFMTGHL